MVVSAPTREPLADATVAEARLVAAALAGSEAAFERLVVRYQKPVIRLLARLVGDAALAEDLAQDTFVKAYRHLHTYDPGRPLASWLFRIAHNTGIDALRRARRPLDHATTLGVDDAPFGDLPAPRDRDPVEQRQLADALGRAFARLRPDQRTALVLRYEDDLPFEEIARVLGIAGATARSHVHRARKQLAEHLRDAGWAPDAPVQRTPSSLRMPE